MQPRRPSETASIIQEAISRNPGADEAEIRQDLREYDSLSEAELFGTDPSLSELEDDASRQRHARLQDLAAKLFGITPKP